MVDVTIGSLQLQIVNAAGHEYRVDGIARRAATIFGERLSERYSTTEGVASSLHVAAVTASPVDLDLNHVSDDEAARQIASAWLDAQALYRDV